jgi:hypothetical protein
VIDTRVDVRGKEGLWVGVRYLVAGLVNDTPG